MATRSQTISQINNTYTIFIFSRYGRGQMNRGREMIAGIYRRIRCYRCRCWLGLSLVVLGWLMFPAIAEASVHTYHEHPGQTTYRSQQSLRDQRDRAWQATLFKRYVDDQMQGAYLRLVGFPGQTVNTDRPLTIQTGSSQHWQLPPALDRQTQELPANVAQYDATAFLSDLKTSIPLTLQVPLPGGTMAQLVTAPFVVDEWLQIRRLEAPTS